MTNQSYDFIGDIHGHARPLRTLLEKLGYREINGVYAHPKRKVVFLGDYIDRGPSIREVLRIVRGMTDSGAALAILGNHEFNALAYSIPDGRGGFLREHNESNNGQHRATLEQLAQPHPAEWSEWLDWIRALPLFLDLGGARAVHAAWDDRAAALARDLGPLTPAKVALMVKRNSAYGRMKEIFLNGLELPLPAGHVFIDKEGHKRTDVRTAWWQELRGKTYREIVFPPGETEPLLPIPQEVIDPVHRPYPVDDPPVFMGHYWLPAIDHPVLQARNIAVLDYSVARGGNLVAYRWDGEQELDPTKFLIVGNAADR